MSDEEFLQAFRDCSLPRKLWSHQAHLRMAWLMLRQLPFTQALQEIRLGIQKYNRSLGNSDGYHDTVTVAYACLLADRMPGFETFEQFLEHHPELLAAGEELLLCHYSRDRLHSDEARKKFVLPDRKPIRLSQE